jgi:hypothetical protein
VAQSKKSTTKNQIQNTVRGALASLRSASVPNRTRVRWRQEQTAREQIYRAMTLAQSSLSAHEIAALEQWIERQPGLQQSSERLGPPLTSLGLVPPDLTARDSVLEVKSAVELLVAHQSPLLKFCEVVTSLQRSFSAGEWKACRSTLTNMGKQFGRSYFELEISTSIEQLIGGVDGMKSFVQKHSVGGSGAHPYLMYMIGVRNEPAQTASRFKEQTKKRHNEAKDISPSLKAYLEYHLARELPLDEIALSSILNAERHGSRIDLLFALLSIIRFASRNSGAFSKRFGLALQQAEVSITPFTKALDLQLQGQRGEFGFRNASQHQYSATKAFLENPSDLAALGHAALEKLWAHERIQSNQNQLEMIVAGAASSLSTQDSGVAGEDLEKLILNMGAIPILSQLGSTTEVPKFVTIYLHLLVKEGPLTSPNTLEEAIEAALLNQLEEENFTAITGGGLMRLLSQVRKIYAQGNIHGALNMLTATTATTDIELDTLQIVTAHLQQQVEIPVDSIKTMAAAGVRNLQLIPLLPLDTVFRGSRWNSILTFGASVELCICLDLYLQSSGDRRARTYKRYAVEELMRSLNCSDLLSLMTIVKAAEIPDDQIEYFFDSVCDIYTLELLPKVGNSRNAQDLRVRLLRSLSVNSTISPHRFREEADVIEASLNVNDGLEMLDASRVYVDEARILPGVQRELSADFQRYLDLVKLGVGVSDSFSDILKSIKHPSEKTFQIPINDADDLFGAITFRIRDRFLFDPASGLDIHIGRRIRHGTIASQLRGPLEARSLIGQRPKLGADYDPPDGIQNLLGTLDRKSRQRVSAAFSRFSEAIDNLIVHLRDETFHVRSKEKPRGIFDVPVNPVFLALARSIAQACPSIEDYSRHCVQMFWMLLSAKMAAERPPMENETRKAISTAFERLGQELRAAGVADATLHVSIQQALEELRRHVVELGSWMRVPKSSIEGRTFSIQRTVDVATALVKGQRSGFKPEIVSSVPSDLELDYYGFSVVVDALYIGIDNVYAHSGKRTDNKISIDILFEPKKSLIYFRILSELGRDGRTSEKENHLNVIRANISKKAYADSARKDKNSGLSKLAALVLQGADTTISFGFVDRTHFELKFELHYIQSDRINRGSYDDLIDSFESLDSAPKEA